jgi:hypothetical protein
VIVADGRAFTVTTVAVLVVEQVEVFVTTTVYEPLAFAVYDEDVAPLIAIALLNHWYESPVPVFAFNTTLPP